MSLVYCNKHNTCLKYANATGVGCVLFRNMNQFEKAVLLGRENGGRYQGLYNISSGKIELYDKGCIIKALIRELREEFKIDLSDMKFFNSVFKDNISGIRSFQFSDSNNVLYPTIIFTGILPIGIKRTILNNIIYQDNMNPYALPQFKEIGEVDWFKYYVKTDSIVLEQIENKLLYTSNFAIRCVYLAKMYYPFLI